MPKLHLAFGRPARIPTNVNARHGKYEIRHYDPGPVATLAFAGGGERLGAWECSRDEHSAVL
jgi:hypothetical protein